jgi:hypothetical protein
MVQFLSIHFFLLDFFNFCWGFQKFPFFGVSLYDADMHIKTHKTTTMAVAAAAATTSASPSQFSFLLPKGVAV